MSWLWFAVLDGDAPGDPVAQASFNDEETRGAGVLAAWPSDARPGVPATKIDARIIDQAGPAGRVSLVLAPSAVRLLFDDTSVQGARRAALSASFPPRFCSTLVRGDSIFAGAVTARDEHGVDDPFARIFPARSLKVEAGLFADWVPPPAGPVIERYGSGNPWPFDRFESTQ